MVTSSIMILFLGSTTAQDTEERSHVSIMNIKDTVLEEQEAVIDDLWELFLDDKLNSELLVDAYQRYDAFEAILNDLCQKTDNPEEDNVITEDRPSEDILQDRMSCELYVSEHKALVKKMMENYNVESGGGKISFHLINKMKDINEGLRELNEGFGKMYGGFKTFADKLPGVTK